MDVFEHWVGYNAGTVFGVVGRSEQGRRKVNNGY